MNYRTSGAGINFDKEFGVKVDVIFEFLTGVMRPVTIDLVYPILAAFLELYSTIVDYVVLCTITKEKPFYAKVEVFF